MRQLVLGQSTIHLPPDVPWIIRLQFGWKQSFREVLITDGTCESLDRTGANRGSLPIEGRWVRSSVLGRVANRDTCWKVVPDNTSELCRPI